MVTAAASERGAGKEPAFVPVASAPPPGRGNAWTAGTAADDPPPKISAWAPATPAAASRTGALSVPIRRADPVAVRSVYTASDEAPPGTSPPSTISRPEDPATATSRLSGPGNCHGSTPNSAAGRPAAAAARTGAFPAPAARAFPAPAAGPP